jgi:chaperonin GroEL (HSP60 family)
MAHMAAKQVFRAAAREEALRGATQLPDAVHVTLGPNDPFRLTPGCPRVR